MSNAHGIKRDRHAGGKREMVCRCGWKIEQAPCEAQARFLAHVRFRRAVELLPPSLRARFGWLGAGLSKAGTLGEMMSASRRPKQ